jgi:hypothetical protein
LRWRKRATKRVLSLRKRIFHMRESDKRTEHNRRTTMHALKDLLTTDYGLMSVAVIALVLAMGGWYVRYFLHRMHEDAVRAAAAGK